MKPLQALNNLGAFLELYIASKPEPERVVLRQFIAEQFQIVEQALKETEPHDAEATPS